MKPANPEKYRGIGKWRVQLPETFSGEWYDLPNYKISEDGSKLHLINYNADDAADIRFRCTIYFEEFSPLQREFQVYLPSKTGISFKNYIYNILNII